MQRILRVGIFALVAGLLAALTWVAFNRSGGPRLQGRTVQQWFEQCARSVQVDGTIQDTAAVQAVLSFGQQSVPCLASGLLQRNGSYAEEWNGIRDKLPTAATNVVPHRQEVGEAWRRAWAAHEILTAAAPEIKRAVAKAAVPPLLAEVRNPKTEDRGYRLSFMQVLEPDPGLVIPELSRLLSDPDPTVRQAACGFLRRYGKAAEPAMDNLVHLLTNQEPNTVYARAFAMDVLGGIGSEAKPAVPVLQSFFKHSNTNLSLAASNALWQIAPELAGESVSR